MEQEDLGWEPFLDVAWTSPLHPATDREMPLRAGGNLQGHVFSKSRDRKGRGHNLGQHVGVMEAALAVFMPDRIEFIEIKKVGLAQKEDRTTKELYPNI